MTQREFRCSVDALARAEPIFATASLVSAWLLIEQPGAWGPDALTESGFPVDVARELQRRAGGVRILLIRHRSRSNESPVYLKAFSGREDQTPAMVSAPLPDPAELLDVDFGALSLGDVGPGEPVEDPTYLVCTHGRHDICCADNGRPCYRAMSEIRPDRSWEVSHLGGDRFAGNLLVLPRGDYFGRVKPDEAVPLVTDYEAGRIDLDHHRGRSIQPRLVQAAEYFVRESEGLRAFDDLVVTGYRRSAGDHAEVVFDAPGGAIRVRVVARVLPEEAILTCDAVMPGHPVTYDLVSVARE